MKKIIIPLKRKWNRTMQIACMALLFFIYSEMPVLGQPSISPDDMVSKCDVANTDLDSLRIPYGTRFVFEAEAAIEGTHIGGWHLDTTQAIYSGNGYLVYTGEGKNDTTDPVPLIYIWYVTKAQNYKIWFRNRRDRGEGGCDIDAEGDHCNDVFASLDGSVIDKTTGISPFGEGWDWGNRNTQKAPYTRNLDVGVHVLRIGGRSGGVKLDQILIQPTSEGMPSTSDPASQTNDSVNVPIDKTQICDINEGVDESTLPHGTRFIFEAEDGMTGDRIGGWQRDTTHAGFCGSAYLLYDGQQKNDTDNPIPLIYRWYITEPGKYLIWFRGRRDYGEGGCPNDAEGDACNDIFAALDYQASKKKLVKHPFGAGWGWGTPTTDYVPYNMYMGVGMHWLQIGGRSKGVKLDQIVIVPESEGKPRTNGCLSETPPDNTGSYYRESPQDDNSMFDLAPNPSNGIFKLIFNTEVESADIEVFDLNGRSILKTCVNSQIAEMDLAHLQNGAYVVKASDANTYDTKMIILK